jgi:hypothetical protein
MVGEAAEAVSGCAILNLNACDVCNSDACNNDVFGQKAMAGAAAEVVTVAIMLLARLTP